MDPRKSSGAYDNYCDPSRKGSAADPRKGSLANAYRKDTGPEGYRGPTQLNDPSSRRQSGEYR